MSELQLILKAVWDHVISVQEAEDRLQSLGFKFNAIREAHEILWEGDPLGGIIKVPDGRCYFDYGDNVHVYGNLIKT